MRVRVRRPLSNIAKERRQALCASLNEHQKRQNGMKALFIICGAFLLFASDVAYNDGDGLRDLVSFIKTN